MCPAFPQYMIGLIVRTAGLYLALRLLSFNFTHLVHILYVSMTYSCITFYHDSSKKIVVG